MREQFRQGLDERLVALRQPVLSDDEVIAVDAFTNSLGPVEMHEDDMWKMYVNKIVADRDEAFVDAINTYITGHNYEPLSNNEALALISYRNEFEAAGTNVWDGTRDDHYASWVLNNRTILNNEIKFTLRTPEGEDMKPYSRILTSYSGADAMFVLNGEIVGEAQEITWTQFLKRPYVDGYPVHGKIVFAVFDRDPIKELIKRERTTMGIIFANEYGQRAFTKITSPEFTTMQGGISVDSIMQECVYYFVAEDVGMIKFDGPITNDDGTLNPIFDK